MAKGQWRVVQRAEDSTWWITDGRESFRMVDEFNARMIVAYLNTPEQPR